MLRLPSRSPLRRVRLLAVLLFTALATARPLFAQPAFRPPAVPLVTHDPYFSIWSMNDRLTDGPTRHWTGTCASAHRPRPHRRARRSASWGICRPTCRR